MIRFKVVKGSHLVLFIASAILVAVILFILLTGSFSTAQLKTAELHNSPPIEISEAKAVSAFASNNLRIDIIADRPLPSNTSAEAQSILIYHTHTHEAYKQDLNNPYVAVEAWRTNDAEHSVVRVGAVLAQELRAKGYEVIHDTTDHEQDSISDSYVRSLHTLESYRQEFDLCIDLHRDAYLDGAKLCLPSGNTEYAQLMMLVGRGDNYDAPDKPSYETNLEFAQRLTSNLNRIIPDICRNVTVKAGRYNQHIGDIGILIEAGHNLNTLQQVLNSIPVLADAIDKSMQQLD